VIGVKANTQAANELLAGVVARLFVVKSALSKHCSRQLAAEAERDPCSGWREAAPAAANAATMTPLRAARIKQFV